LKKLFFVVMLAIASTCVNAQKSSFFLEQQNIYNIDAQKYNTNVFIWAANDINKHWGTFAFGMVNQNWGELYAGPKYTTSIKKGFVEVGYGLGLEVSKNKGLRNGAYVFIQTKKDSTEKVKGKTQVMIFGEHGPSGPWLLGFYTRGITKHLSVGVHGQRFSATGPRIQFDSRNFMTYIVPGVNIETGKPTGHLGLRLYF
jgi:hypothetical protein